MFLWNGIASRNDSALTFVVQIQDYDIDVPRPQPFQSIDDSLLHLLNFWIDVSRVQGKICWLYSPGALSQTLEERGRLVNELASELNRAFEIRLKVWDVA